MSANMLAWFLLGDETGYSPILAQMSLRDKLDYRIQLVRYIPLRERSSPHLERASMDYIVQLSSRTLSYAYYSLVTGTTAKFISHSY